MIDLKLLEKLCSFCCVSGDEKKIRDFILAQVRPFADDIKVDNLGNLIVFKRGAAAASKKVVVSAHMDEIGFIVTHICDDGTLKFANVGGINKLAVPTQRVLVGSECLLGVIGLKPKHLQKPDEVNIPVEIDTLCIDIGAVSKQEASKRVSIGDSVCFEPVFDITEDVIKAKALDDRAGCLLLIDMIKSELKYDTYFTFVTQEEVGLRGSTVAAYTVAPDRALILDVTVASDIAGIPPEREVAKLRHGPAVSFMDAHTVYDREYLKLATQTADSLGLPYQYKRAVTGGNDAGSFHKARGGAKCVSVSLICRYLHCCLGIITLQDLENWRTLSFELLNTIHEKQD